MAKMKLEGLEEVSIMVRQMAEQGEAVAKAAVFAGAAVAIEEVKRQIQALPTESGYMPNGQKRQVVKPTEKQALLDHVGIARFDSVGGKVTTSISFDGYAEELPTNKHPGGLPVPLLARSIESGSSVRQKQPFMRRAAAACKERVQAEMQAAAEAVINESLGR